LCIIRDSIWKPWSDFDIVERYNKLDFYWVIAFRFQIVTLIFYQWMFIQMNSKSSFWFFMSCSFQMCSYSKIPMRSVLPVRSCLNCYISNDRAIIRFNTDRLPNSLSRKSWTLFEELNSFQNFWINFYNTLHRGYSENYSQKLVELSEKNILLNLLVSKRML
jgi:hypothetical protein